MDFTGKVALVTGAGSGIGAAAARLLAASGARVGLLDRDAEELEEVATGIGGDGGEAITLAADLTDHARVEGAVAELFERWGRLDVVVANAGINGVWAPIEELDLDEWQATIDVNLTGTFATLRAAVPYLRRDKEGARGGAVVVTASVNGTRMFSNTGATAYSATKAAQVAMTKMLALELAPDGVRVNVICPGWIATHIDESTDKQDVDAAKYPVEYPAGSVPLTGGAPGRPEQVAALIRFLASDDASHITGTEVWIDGAQSLLQG